MLSKAELTLVMRAKNFASREADKLSHSLGGVRGAAGKAGNAIKSFGKVAIFGLAGLAVGAVAALPGLTKLAGELELMGKKASTVFGDQLDSVQKWAAANANAMGLTSRRAVGLAANFADLLIPMGFTREAAARMSTEVVGLSGALALWSGGTKTAAEVSDILAKAMLGEREGLKSLGISISEADVSAQLLKNGTNKLTGAQLEQAKATATQQLIFAKSKDAQDAYAKSTKGLAGQQAMLGAKFDELVEKIAIGVTPVLTALFTWILDEAIPSLQELAPAVAWVGAVFEHNLLPFLRNTVAEIKHLVAWIKDAVAWLGRLREGAANMPGTNWFNLPMPQFGAGHAEGGWAGLHGPELSVLGERGPEFVRKAGTGTGNGGGMTPGYVAVAVSEKDLARMVDERLYFTLRRAAPTSGRI